MKTPKNDRVIKCDGLTKGDCTARELAQQKQKLSNVKRLLRQKQQTQMKQHTGLLATNTAAKALAGLALK